MAQTIKYAIDQSSKVSKHIDEVSNGLGCNCICAECNQKMIAVQGEQRKREWHFRHSEDTNCQGGSETALHKYAKQIIVENFAIQIPNENLVYSNALSEEPFQTFVPDVTVQTDNGNVHFEIVVTNPVNTLKERFYKEGKHKSIEIDLSDISRDIPPQDLKDLILKNSHNKRKIYWEEKFVTSATGNDGGVWLFLLGLAAAIFFFFRPKKSRKRF